MSSDDSWLNLALSQFHVIDQIIGQRQTWLNFNGIICQGIMCRDILPWI